MVRLFLRHPLFRQFVRFCIVGTTNFLLDIGIYFVLTRGAQLHFLLANGIAFILVVSWSYYWNKRWTFRDSTRMHLAQYARFVVVVLVGLGLAEGGLWVLVQQLNMFDLFAKFVIGIVIAFWNFGMNRAWTFAAIDTTARV
ncbi:GtrA family protein [Candidatus Uhrbacteria bacterium]|nr:GtrA family protein [Candidatus Uhrbacteria bacterium]